MDELWSRWTSQSHSRLNALNAQGVPQIQEVEVVWRWVCAVRSRRRNFVRSRSLRQVNTSKPKLWEPAVGKQMETAMSQQSSMHFYINWAKERIDEMDTALASFEVKGATSVFWHRFKTAPWREVSDGDRENFTAGGVFVTKNYELPTL